MAPVSSSLCSCCHLLSKLSHPEGVRVSILSSSYKRRNRITSAGVNFGLVFCEHCCYRNWALFVVPNGATCGVLGVRAFLRCAVSFPPGNSRDCFNGGLGSGAGSKSSASLSLDCTGSRRLSGCVTASDKIDAPSSSPSSSAICTSGNTGLDAGSGSGTGSGSDSGTSSMFGGEQGASSSACDPTSPTTEGGDDGTFSLFATRGS